MDKRSEKIIETLLPQVQPVFRDFLLALKNYFKAQEISAVAICGHRSYAEQDALYRKGRIAPGNRVTKARGGYSYHNFGIAMDVGLFKEGKYLTDSKVYKEIGHVVCKFPTLEWGGDWTSFQDMPHVQYRISCTMAALRERVAQGKAIV